MTTRELLREELKKELHIGYGSVSKIEHYMETGNYLQIFFTYGIQALQVLLDYNIYIEDYKACITIRDVVKSNNKAQGTNYILK